MSTTQSTIKTFEEKFKAFVPHEMRVSSKPKDQELPERHIAGIIVKSIAYLIDLAMVALILPIIANIYYYLKWGQSIGQAIVGIRIYQNNTHEHIIGSLPQLLTRFGVKLAFLASWTAIGATAMTLLFGGEDMIINDPINKLCYIIVMIIWIHGYVITMYLNSHRRGLQDVLSGTVVAYDHAQSTKRIVLGAILVLCLWYLILVIGPWLLYQISHLFNGPWIDYYWSFWSWIDYRVVRGMYVFGLAN